MHKNYLKYLPFMLFPSILLSACASTTEPENECNSMNLVSCNGICIDPMTSHEYCGADTTCSLFSVCLEDEYCQKGKCQKIVSQEPDICDSMELVNCNGVCIDPMSSPKYCGAQKNCSQYTTCLQDEFCQNGICIKIITEQKPEKPQDNPNACAGFKNYCKNNSIIGCRDGNIIVEEFCTGINPVCDPKTVTCIALPNAICTDGEFKCESNTPSICVGNTWHSKTLCPNGTYCNSISGECTTGDVVLAPNESCMDDNVRCENNIPMICQNSKWSIKDKCTEDSYCNSITAKCDKFAIIDCTNSPEDPNCIPPAPPSIICTENNERCFNASLQKCKTNSWTDTHQCESGQCANESECAEFVCHASDIQCSDEAVVQYCYNNQWHDLIDCQSKQCIEGKCIESEQTSQSVLCDGNYIDPSSSDKYCGADKTCTYFDNCTNSSIDELTCYKGRCESKCTIYDDSAFQSLLYKYYDKDSNGCISPEEADSINIRDLVNLKSIFYAESKELSWNDITEIPTDFYISSFNGYDIDSFNIPNVSIINEKAFYTEEAAEPAICNRSESVTVICSGKTGAVPMQRTEKAFKSSPFKAHYTRFANLNLPKVKRIEKDAFSSNYQGNQNVTYIRYSKCEDTPITSYRCVPESLYPKLPMNTINLSNLQYLGARGLFAIVSNEYIFPNLTEIGEYAISVTSINPNAIISITSKEDILLHGNWIAFDKFSIGTLQSDCTCKNKKTIDPQPILIVHKNKAPGGGGSPTVDLENLTWGGIQFKEIQFVD